MPGYRAEPEITHDPSLSWHELYTFLIAAGLGLLTLYLGFLLLVFVKLLLRSCLRMARNCVTRAAVRAATASGDKSHTA